MLPRGLNAIALAEAERILDQEIDVPEELIDLYITQEIVDTAVILDGQHMVDQNALWAWWDKAIYNPETREYDTKPNYWLNPKTKLPFTSYVVDAELGTRAKIFAQTHFEDAQEKAAKKMSAKWQKADQKKKALAEEKDFKMAKQLHIDLMKERRDERIKNNFENRIAIYTALLSEGYNPQAAMQMAKKADQQASFLETIVLFPESDLSKISLNHSTFFAPTYFSRLAAERIAESLNQRAPEEVNNNNYRGKRLGRSYEDVD